MSAANPIGALVAELASLPERELERRRDELAAMHLAVVLELERRASESCLGPCSGHLHGPQPMTSPSSPAGRVVIELRRLSPGVLTRSILDKVVELSEWSWSGLIRIDVLRRAVDPADLLQRSEFVDALLALEQQRLIQLSIANDLTRVNRDECIDLGARGLVTYVMRGDAP